MNKGELVKAISEDCEVNRSQAMEMLDSFLSRVQKELSSGGFLLIPGFGSFKVISAAARRVRSPQDGLIINVPAKKRVKFVVGKVLKEAVNK